MAVCSARVSGVCLMMVLVSVFIGSSTAANETAGAELFKRCARDAPNVNECLNEAIQSAIRSLKDGYDALGLSKLDPLNLDKVTLRSPDGKTLDLLNFDVYGLASVVCQNSSYTSSANSFRLSFDLQVPQFEAKGPYKMERFFLGTPHANEGVFSLNLTGYRANFVLDGNIERKEDGNTYAKISGKSSSFNGGTNFRVHFSNLSKGRNRLWNREPEQLLQAYKTAIDQVHPVLAANYANLIFQKVPLDQLFPATLSDNSIPGNKLTVKWGRNGTNGGDSFYAMPRTVNDLEYADAGFRQVASRTHLDHTTVHCQNDDHRMCLLFDKLGSVAGVMLSVLAEEVVQSNVPHFLSFSEKRQVFRQELLGRDVYSAIMYFISKEQRRNGRLLTENDPTASDSLYMWQKDQEMKIPGNASLTEKLRFSKQGCLAGMGAHYVYDIGPDLQCDTQIPFLLLVNPKTQLVHGFTLIIFGKNISSGQWLESFSLEGLKVMLSTAQQCIFDHAERYSTSFLHFYFTPNPWTLAC